MKIFFQNQIFKNLLKMTLHGKPIGLKFGCPLRITFTLNNSNEVGHILSAPSKPLINTLNIYLTQINCNFTNFGHFHGPMEETLRVTYKFIN